ncbi:hypothetical protein RV13_GL003039 [Enterococcus raffinosus]|nr:hypothetical protein RV13_GL003039 [Enterococcus raffinosus]
MKLTITPIIGKSFIQSSIIAPRKSISSMIGAAIAIIRTFIIGLS